MGVPTPQTPTPTDLVPLAADAPPTCDELGCGEPATHSYTWDWGQSGFVCAKHAALLQQRAENLNRKVHVTVLRAQPVTAITRDERIQLRATILALEAELDETKQRGLDLYRENVDLTKQVQTLVTRERERDAQLADAAQRLEQLDAKLGAKDAEHADLVNEVKRLRTLAKFIESPSTTATSETRVD